MATSAFKSTTKRSPVADDSCSRESSGSGRSLRRSRSLSRFSHTISPEYIKNVPRGKFVNTERGSTAAVLPEISLDDLALKFFPSSSLNENESDEGKGREGRSVSRHGGEVGRWARDTASSRRRERSVSRSRGNAVKSSEPKDCISSSAAGLRGLSVSRSRGDAVSSSGIKKVIPSSDVGFHRRRSQSVAPYHQISDSESEVDRCRSSSNHTSMKGPIRGNSQMPLVKKAIAPSNWQLEKSRSNKDLSMLQDGYSSHSSALTDEEPKDISFPRNGFEKIIGPVYAKNKIEYPTEDVANGGLYDAMRKEVRYAVQEIRTEISQIEMCKQDLRTEMLLEEWEPEVSKNFREFPESRFSIVREKPSRARKSSSDRNRMSKRLTDEAERYFEDFISNIEDTDISSFDGERSDSSSTLGGRMKARDHSLIRRENEIYKSPVGFSSCPIEMDGIILPWLQWEISGDGFLSSNNNKEHASVTPKALQWELEKDIPILHDSNSYSNSRHGGSSPGIFKKNAGKITKNDNERSNPSFDMEEYLKLEKNEELLFEMYREQNMISSGGLLLCTSIF